MLNNFSLTNTHWWFHFVSHFLNIYLSLKHYTAVAEKKAGAYVTSCNQVPVMWPDFNEIGHATAFYGNTNVLA